MSLMLQTPRRKSRKSLAIYKWPEGDDGFKTQAVFAPHEARQGRLLDAVFPNQINLPAPGIFDSDQKITSELVDVHGILYELNHVISRLMTYNIMTNVIS